MESGSRYHQLMRRAVAESHPIAALCELTYRCNLDCVYCYNDRLSVRQPLDTGEWIRVLEQAAELGVLHLALSGGEPLLHPGFFDILAAARELGFVTRVKTNGHTLGTRVARRILDVGDPFMVDVSIHGADAETHERQTRVPGTFERLLTNLEQARAAGLRIKLVCTLTRWNQDQYEAITAIASELGLPVRFSAEVAPRDNGSTDTFSLKMEPTAYRLFRAWLGEQGDGVELEDEGSGTPERTCGAAGSGFAVDPSGNVLACVQWRAPAGNVRTEPLQEIWRSSAGLRQARAVVTDAVSHLGPGESACHFCPGMAYVVTGDPLAEYRDQAHPLGVSEQTRACGCGARSE